MCHRCRCGYNAGLVWVGYHGQAQRLSELSDGLATISANNGDAKNAATLLHPPSRSLLLICVMSRTVTNHDAATSKHHLSYTQQFLYAAKRCVAHICALPKTRVTSGFSVLCPQNDRDCLDFRRENNRSRPFVPTITDCTRMVTGRGGRQQAQEQRRADGSDDDIS